MIDKIDAQPSAPGVEPQDKEPIAYNPNEQVLASGEPVSEKWYRHPAAQPIVSIGVFVFMSAIIFGLGTVFWTYLSAYRDAKTSVVVNITAENLAGAARELKSDSKSFNPADRDQSIVASKHLEGAAHETQEPHRFLLKSATASAPRWLQIAFDQLTQKEVAGAEHNRWILQYINSIEPDVIPSSLTDELPWVSSFINWTIEQAKMTGTNDAAAQSWLAWGDPLSKPRPGAIAVFKTETRPGGGYVGFFLSETPNYIIVLGGDFGNAVRIGSLKKSDLLGYRWPRSD